MFVPECPSGLSDLVNCCLHANLNLKKKRESCDCLTPDRHSAFIIYAFKREKNVAIDVNDSEKEGK